MGPRAAKVVVTVCGIMGGWFGYWLGQPSISLRYWIAEPAAGTENESFAWWTRNIDWQSPELQRRLDYLADEQLFPLWRFLLSVGLAVLFAYLATLIITRLPLWRLQDVLRNGVQGEAMVVQVRDTGEYMRGPTGLERQIAVELHTRVGGRPPYRARTTQFFNESEQRALQPGTRVVVRCDPARLTRVAIVEPVSTQGVSPST